MIELIFTVLIVILISANCSLFEAVLYSVPVSHVEGLAEQGKRTGHILRRLRRRVDEPISAVLTLNTIANTAGAAVAGAMAAKALGTGNVVVFSAVFTVLILLFAEVIPKTAGVVYSRGLSSFVAGPLQVLVWVLKPAVWLIGLITRAVAGKRAPDQVSGDEIMVMARLGLRKGVIDKDEALVIQNILSLEKKAVREVMTPRTVLFTLSGYLTVEDARRVDGILTHSRIPVYFKNNEDIGGIVYRLEIFAVEPERTAQVKIEQLIKPIHFVLDRSKLDHVLKLFFERGEHIFVVIDEYGGLSGIITLEDVLEEILGKEIVDEFDEVADMRKLARRRRDEILQRARSADPTKKTQSEKPKPSDQRGK